MSGLEDIRASSDLRRWIVDAYARYLDELVLAGAAYARDANGLWQPDLLPYWLEETDCATLAFVRDSEPVAFSFVGLEAFPFRRHATTFCLAEFWVAPEHRRGGTGGVFARALFERHPGSWELTVLTANTPALAFWRRVLPSRHEIVAEDGIDFVFETSRE